MLPKCVATRMVTLIEAILQHSSVDLRRYIMDACRGDICALAGDRCGSLVLQSALRFANANEQCLIIDELLREDSASVAYLCKQEYGANLLLTAATLQTQETRKHREYLVDTLQSLAGRQLLQDEYSQQLVRALGRLCVL